MQIDFALKWFQFINLNKSQFWWWIIYATSTATFGNSTGLQRLPSRKIQSALIRWLGETVLLGMIYSIYMFAGKLNNYLEFKINFQQFFVSYSSGFRLSKIINLILSLVYHLMNDFPENAFSVSSKVFEREWRLLSKFK